MEFAAFHWLLESHFFWDPCTAASHSFKYPVRGAGGREPCFTKEIPRRARCSGCYLWQWGGCCWCLFAVPNRHLLTSISCLQPLVPPCPLPYPGLITHKAFMGQGITSPLCQYTAPRQDFELVTVSPLNTFCMSLLFSPCCCLYVLCPFIIMTDGSEAQPPLYHLSLSITSYLPSSMSLCLSFFVLPLTHPSFLPPRGRRLTIADSCSASWSRIASMKL